MALDTAAKRANVAGVGRVWMRTPWPGANSVQWRMSRGLSYGGNALSAVVDTGAIEGRINVVPSVHGRIHIAPNVEGEINIVPSVGGSIRIEP